MEWPASNTPGPFPQAEHYVGAVRDHAALPRLLREGSPLHRRGATTICRPRRPAHFQDSHVGALEPGALRAALSASPSALVREGGAAGLPHVRVVAERLVHILVDRNRSP